MQRKGYFQPTLASQLVVEKYVRKSRREQFLSLMESVVPWRELEAVIERYYPKLGNGRPPVGLSIMLRVYFLRPWFNLSAFGAEDALYESPLLRHFAGCRPGLRTGAGREDDPSHSPPAGDARVIRTDTRHGQS